jgi:outer membrane protein assembly factor BamB
MKAAGPLLLFALIISIAADKKIPAWPQYRGPGGSGIAADTDNPPTEFGPTKHLLWKTTVPSGHSSPSIWADRLFLTTFDKPTKMLEVMALSRGNGKLIWRRATPATDGERVYAYFGSYGLICFDRDG